MSAVSCDLDSRKDSEDFSTMTIAPKSVDKMTTKRARYNKQVVQTAPLFTSIGCSFEPMILVGLHVCYSIASSSYTTTTAFHPNLKVTDMFALSDDRKNLTHVSSAATRVVHAQARTTNLVPRFMTCSWRMLTPLRQELMASPK
jgi:hypothetical protein